ncbi:hypothetical protein EA007_20675, partial [Vibrio anguillarum]|nr:hypothetical protein [Vibrio anguillarum]
YVRDLALILRVTNASIPIWILRLNRLWRWVLSKFESSLNERIKRNAYFQKVIKHTYLFFLVIKESG